MSYWDTRHGAVWITPLEAALASFPAITMWRQRLGWGITTAVAALLLAELWVVRNWLFFFITA